MLPTEFANNAGHFLYLFKRPSETQRSIYYCAKFVPATVLGDGFCKDFVLRAPDWPFSPLERRFDEAGNRRMGKKIVVFARSPRPSRVRTRVIM